MSYWHFNPSVEFQPPMREPDPHKRYLRDWGLARMGALLEGLCDAEASAIATLVAMNGANRAWRRASRKRAK